MTVRIFKSNENDIKKSLASKEPRTDQEILRAAIIAEYDAINLYEQFANKTSDEKLKKLLLDISKEEKIHVGEFEQLLEKFDSTHKEKVTEGRTEGMNL